MVKIDEIETHTRIRARADGHLPAAPSKRGEALFKDRSTDHVEDDFYAFTLSDLADGRCQVGALKIDPFFDGQDVSGGNFRRWRTVPITRAPRLCAMLAAAPPTAPVVPKMSAVSPDLISAVITSAAHAVM